MMRKAALSGVSSGGRLKQARTVMTSVPNVDALVDRRIKGGDPRRGLVEAFEHRDRPGPRRRRSKQQCRRRQRHATPVQDPAFL